MRHISFDESTVLRELARISDERGIVKSAAPNPMDALLQAVKSEIPTGATKPVWDGFAQEVAGARNADPAEAKKILLNRWKDPKMQSLINQHLTTSPGEPSAVRSLSEALKAASPRGGIAALQYKMVIDELKGYNPETPAAELKQIMLQRYGKDPGIKAVIEKTLSAAPAAQMAYDGLETSATKNEEAPVKTAKDSKLYDVSGETGEQLVDKAHPGGGTRTELTHSKTDENLVETIVEQQKRDVEVAQKAPKGTYATLRAMKDRLAKLGVHGSFMSKVDSIIKNVATTEDVVAYEMVILADKLDSLGQKEAADKVDGMIVRTADPETGRMMMDWLAKNPGAGAAGGGAGAKALQMAKNVGKGVGRTVAPAAALLGGAAKGVGSAAVAAMPWLLPVAGIGAAGLAAYFIGKDLLAMEDTIDGVIDRLEDLDPNEQAAPVVQQWISTLQQLKPRLQIPQASTDAETQKQIVQQRAKDVQYIAQQLQALQQQYATDIKPNLTDWGFDAGQAERVINQTAASFAQQAQQLAAKLPQVEQAGEKQKVVEEGQGAEGTQPGEKAEEGKGKGKGRTKGNPKVLKQQQEYNKWKGEKVLDEDGLMGPKTRAALKEMRGGKGGAVDQGEAAANASVAKVEEMMLAAFKKRFARLPLSRAPELEKTLRTRAREMYKSKTNFFTEEKAMQDLPGEFEAFVRTLTSDDVKQFIRM